MSERRVIMHFGTPKATGKDFAIGILTASAVLGALVGLLHFSELLLIHH